VKFQRRRGANNHGNPLNAASVDIQQPETEEVSGLYIIIKNGCMSFREAQVTDYLIEENRVLKDQLEGQRLWFTDKQRQ
jgi:hypothetical protein